MRSRPMTVRPWMFFRSALTVSAMPLPIHSSTGSRVMFVKVITAMPLPTGGGGAGRGPLSELRPTPLLR